MEFISLCSPQTPRALPKLLRILTSPDANTNQQSPRSATKEIKGLGDQKKKKATDLGKKRRDDESDFLMGSSFNVVAASTSKIAQSLGRG